MQEIDSLKFHQQDALFIKGQFGTRFKEKMNHSLDVVIERIDCETMFPPPNNPNILWYFIEADVVFL